MRWKLEKPRFIGRWEQRASDNPGAQLLLTLILAISGILLTILFAWLSTSSIRAENSTLTDHFTAEVDKKVQEAVEFLSAELDKSKEMVSTLTGQITSLEQDLGEVPQRVEAARQEAVEAFLAQQPAILRHPEAGLGVRVHMAVSAANQLVEATDDNRAALERNLLVAVKQVELILDFIVMVQEETGALLDGGPLRTAIESGDIEAIQLEVRAYEGLYAAVEEELTRQIAALCNPDALTAAVPS